MATTTLPIRKKVFATKIDAGHDTYGNPRRGWLLYDASGYYLGFVDEGYAGRRALTKVAPKAVELGSVPTTAGAYRDANKDDLGIALIRQGTRKKKRTKKAKSKKARSRKNPKGRSKARSKLRKGKSRKAKSRKAKSRRGKSRVRAKARKAKSRGKSRKKAWSKAVKTKRVSTGNGYRYMVNGKFVKKSVYDRIRGTKGKSRAKSRKKARSKARSKASSRKTRRLATSRGYRYMVDGKFASKADYDRARR